eukprot:1743502-Pleurochrysis_carterae.AAC.1
MLIGQSLTHLAFVDSPNLFSAAPSAAQWESGCGCRSCRRLLPRMQVRHASCRAAQAADPRIRPTQANASTQRYALAKNTVDTGVVLLIL